MSKGTLVILSAPSGCGKDTLAAHLMEQEPDLRISVSMTTRPMRRGDVEGETYHFVSKEEFARLQREDQLYESASYHENDYGTPKAPIQRWLEENKTVLVVIEVVGAEKMRKLFPEAVSIFLLPPSIGALRQRLRGRQTESEEEICRRMDIARREIQRAQEFQYVVVNDCLEEAVDIVRAILVAHRHKAEQMKLSIEEVLKNGES